MNNVFKLTVLVVFLGIQLVQGLKCYHCLTNDEDCEKVEEITCTEEAGNFTNLMIYDAFKQPIVANRNSFSCLWYNETIYNEFGAFKRNLRSCVFTESSPCQSQSRLKVGNEHSCRSCNSDLCNKHNTGSFISSFYVLPVTVSLFIAKNFVST